MHWILLLVVPIAIILIAVLIYYCLKSVAPVTAPPPRSESESFSNERSRSLSTNDRSRSVEEPPPKKSRGMSSAEGSQADQLRSYREDTPTSFRHNDPKSPVLYTCKDKSGESDIVLDETMGSSKGHTPPKTNDTKSSFSISQKKEPAPEQKNPFRSAEPITPPSRRPKSEIKTAKADSARKGTISVTPTTLTGTGRSVEPSTLKSSYASSSQTTFANLARSTTNVLMSEDAGRTPPCLHSPQSGSFESQFPEKHKKRSEKAVI